VRWPTRVASTAYLTRVTGEKIESIGMTPMGWSGCFVFVAGGETSANFDFEVASNLPFLSSVQMCWSLLMTSQPATSWMSAGSDGSLLVHGNLEGAHLVIVRHEFDLLEVENDVGDVFDNVGRVANSCWAPLMRTEVMAAPSREESSTRRRELPTVCP